VLLLALGVAASAPAAEVSMSTGPSLPQPGLRGNAVQGIRIGVGVKSLNEMRWENVIRQGQDISCGAAALATILTYYFDFPTTEEEMFHPLLALAMKEAGPDVREVGFNLRHMRDVAARGGLAAVAFRLTEKNLPQVRVPGIMRVTIRGYDHFLVFKQARGGRVYVADPAFGNTSYRLRSFSKIWSGVLMAFSRRTGEHPVDHLLAVRPEDKRVIETEDIMRVADGLLRVPAEVRLPEYFVFSKFPYIEPGVAGLESVFPSLLWKRIDF
jgi:predicted double-glycine peptidase